jgi:hypothetical protein
MKINDIVKVLNGTKSGAHFEDGEICKVCDPDTGLLRSINTGVRWYVERTNIKLLTKQEILNYRYNR